MGRDGQLCLRSCWVRCTFMAEMETLEVMRSGWLASLLSMTAFGLLGAL